ncbi:MAG: tetratricopeptide repeat protein [Deltaproteobacteria bacterium]|nr:tetratricopeptide repeat protein [Deltaproteobacteria bacterium]
MTSDRGASALGARSLALVLACGLACVSACATEEVKPDEKPGQAGETGEPQKPVETPALPEGAKPEAAPPAPQVDVSAEKKAQAQEAFDAAQAAVQAGDSAGAIQRYLNAASDDPTLTQARVNAAVLMLRGGRIAEAKNQLREVLRVQPDNAAASENLVRLELKTGDLANAHAGLLQRIGQFPASLPLRNQFARVLVAEGKLEQALAESKRVLKADERNVGAMLILGDVWYREKKLELARDVLDTAQAVEPTNAQVANAQGFILLALEQKALALEAFRRAVQCDPSLVEARNNLGILLVEANDFEGAARELTEASKLEPDRPGVWLNLGNALRGARRDQEAEAAYQKALALRPNDPNPLFNLGVLYLDGDFKGTPALDRLSTARTWLSKYREAGGSDPKLGRWEGEADKLIKKEKDRLAREERDKLKKAEAAKKVEDDKKKREAGKLGKIDEDDSAPAQPTPAKPSGKLGGKEDDDK